MADGRTSADYGWRDAEPTCAHAYLEPVVLGWLRRLGARRILDLGCGNGSLCRTLKDTGFEVSGCDADRQGVELARGRNPDIRFEVMNMAEAPGPFAGEIFDAVVSTEVVEHLYNPQQLPQAAGLLLKGGGWLVVTTPYHGYVKNLILSLSNRWDSHHTPLWEGGHIKFWSLATLTELLEREGFRVTGFTGAGRVPPLWKSMVLVAQRP